MTESQHKQHGAAGIPGRGSPQENARDPRTPNANQRPDNAESDAAAAGPTVRTIDVTDLVNASELQRQAVEACWRALDEDDVASDPETRQYLVRCVADVFRPRPNGPASEPID